jgi:cytochrome c oxidase cbb3-type subunit 1
MFTLAAVFWGIIGFMVGVLIASQMAFPILNFDWQYTSFGRLRPLHTSAVIFAFGGNVLFATSFFVVQRTCQTKLWGHKNLHKFTITLFACLEKKTKNMIFNLLLNLNARLSI